MKEPTYQEAAVVAIFHEMLGAGLIKGYRGMQWSYQDTYDFYGYYDISLNDVGSNVCEMYRGKFPNNRLKKPIVMEFKYAGEAVISNVHDEEKSFSDIDLIVCWTIDLSKYEELNFDISIVEDEDRFYHSSKYSIKTSSNYGSHEFYVIVLKDLIDDLKKEIE